MTTVPQKEKPANDIRVGSNTRAGRVIQYATLIMKEKNLRDLKFSAVGNSISTLINIAEVLKINIPGLYQQNKIASVSYQTVDSAKNVIAQKILPKLEVTLSLDPFSGSAEGNQDKYDETTRKSLETALNKERENRGGNRGRGFRGRGRGIRGRGRGRPFRGRGRGFRGRGRGFGTRGTRGTRGSDRGSRGMRTTRGNRGK